MRALAEVREYQKDVFAARSRVPLRNSTLVVSVLALAMPTLPLAQATPEPITLPQGTTLHTSQRAGELVTYAFEAEQGRTYLIELDQQGLDFIVTVEDPAGEARSFNSPLFRDEAELVLLENTAAGPYRFTVASREPTHASGTHSISVSSPAPEIDARYIEAWRHMNDGAAANADEARAREALAYYEDAADLWHALGETELYAQSLYSAAMVRYWSLYDWDGSAEQASRAAAVYLQRDAPALYANALLLASYSLMEVAQVAGEGGQRAFDQAFAGFRESRAVHESLGNTYQLAQVENYTGLAYFNRGRARSEDFRQAETHYRHAEQLFSSLGEWREELNVRHNLAVINIDEGYAAAAVGVLEDILADIPEGQDPSFRGMVLSNLGVAYRDAGNYDSALHTFSEAVRIHGALNQFNWEGFALRGLGTTYLALGELERAGEYLRQALEKSPDDGRVRASVLASLGNVAYLSASYSEALDLHQRAVESTASASERAYREAFVARDLVALGRFNDAIAVAKRALQAGDVADITKADSALELGHAYLGLGKIQEAAENFDTAVAIFGQSGLQIKEAEALKGRALAARDHGDLSGAIRFGEAALQRIEALRMNVTAPELRAFYSAAHGEYYETQIDLLIAAHKQTGHVASDFILAALSVSERARARMTMDLLAEASVDLDRGIPQALLDRQRVLYEELNALRYQRDRVLERPDSVAVDLATLVSRMNAVENELTLLATEVRRSNPLQASLGATDPLAAEGIQALLGARSALVQYSLGGERSYVWVVTSNSIRVVELAEREAIETAARRAYENLKIYRASGPDRDVDAALQTLSDLVIAPIAPLLESRDRLIVAAAGALQYIPFGVLPMVRNGASVPILQGAEVSSVPSISVLAAQSRQRATTRPTKTLAVFADPVFTATDSRLTRPESTGADTRLTDSSSVMPFGSFRLTRLAATGAEARAIAAMVPEGLRFVATGLEATRDSVLSERLSDYRIVHFGTHGLVDSRYPGLSSLALSQFDTAGLPQDGFLRLHDIYSMDLNADLVVLSACETALGREIRGEGLIGLVHGFLYAGARSLVVSLWQVPDRATAELMTRFYSYVLKDGLRPAEALRHAQLSVAAERRWSGPYFWAAFIVIGN